MSQIIKKLTAKQVSRFPYYRDKWLKIGLSTERCNRKEAELACKSAYQMAELKPPEKIYWSSSPLGCILFLNYLKILNTQLNNEHQVWDQVRDQVQAQVWAQVRDQVYGAHDSNWLSCYDFFHQECQLNDCQKLAPLMDLAKNCGWWAPYENVAVLQEKPSRIVMSEGRLHCEDGPSIQYEDGFSIYSLNGIRMPEFLFQTSKDKIDPKSVFGIKNVEQRAQAIRFVGIHRMKSQMKVKVLDRFNDYELWMTEFEGKQVGPWLKMVDPSDGETKVEGVGKECQTCEEALAWREGEREEYYGYSWEA